MDVMERLRQLVAMMNDNDLSEIEIEENDTRIRVSKSQPVQYVPPGYGTNELDMGEPPPALQEGQGPEEEQKPAPHDENLVEVTSPMVGTFYRSNSPGADPYVSVGSHVESDSVVCIVEAMKVMNEIKAGVEGEIKEILVEDAEPVEFGQTLFLVEPAE